MAKKVWSHPDLTPEKLKEVVAGAFAREGHLFIFAVTSDKEDTEFISHAPWAIRELSKECDSLRDEIERLQILLDEANHHIAHEGTLAELTKTNQQILEILKRQQPTPHQEA